MRSITRRTQFLGATVLSLLVILAAGVGGCSDRTDTRDMEEASVISAARSAFESVAPGRRAARFAGRDPGLAAAADGGLHIAYVVDGESGSAVVYRRLAVSGTLHDAVTVSPPDADVSAHGEVPPRIVRLDDGEGAEKLAVVYSVRLPGKWKGEILLQRSVDGGRSWTPPERLHDDAGAGGSHSFVDAVSLAGGGAAFAWLDNRDGAQGLRATRLGDDGAVAVNRTVDSVTCQCCATALLADGPEVFVAYRDLEGSVRDISMAASRDRGATFELLGPVSDDGWEIDGCPHTGPRLARGAGGALWATWFTGAQAGIYAASLAAGATHFDPRQPVAVPGIAEPELAYVAHPEIGRLQDGRLVVLYEAVRGGTSGIEVRSIDGSTANGPPRRIVEGGAFPRLSKSDGRTWLSYTLVGDFSEVIVIDLDTLLS